MARLEFREQVPQLDEALALYGTTDWPEFEGLTRAEVESSLAASWFCVCVYEQEQCVGMGRVLSDGIVYALILDVIIAPDHRGAGLGRTVMDRLLTHCREAGIRDVLLFAAPGTGPFYERLGFHRRDPEAPGMQLG